MNNYVVLYEEWGHRLEKKVNEYIDKGYKPQGGISIEKSSESTTNCYYYQAMIKEDK